MSSDSSIELLEDSVALLRALAPGAWLPYAAGATPFFLAILFGVARLTTGSLRVSDAVLGAFVLAILFLWWSWSKVLFTARLAEQLCGSERMLAAGIAFPSQILGQSLKLFLFPLAMAAVIPLPWVVAFFRSIAPAAAFAPLLNPRVALARAASLARLLPIQNALALSILVICGTVLFVNCLLLVVGAPFLARILSGAENSWTLNPVAAFNWTTVAAALALTLLGLDPLLQAMYTLRCFRLNAGTSGADISAALRRLPVILLAIAVCGCGGQSLRAAPRSSAEVTSALHRALTKPEYAWISHPTRPAAPLSGPVEFLLRKTQAAGRWVFRLIRDLLRRIFHRSPQDIEQGRSRPQSNTVQGVVIAGVIIAAGILAFVLRNYFAKSTQRQPDSVAAAASRAPVAEGALATERPEEEWHALAETAFSARDYRTALRALFLANLAWFARANLVTVSRYKSNREYERELRVRSRSEDLASLFGANRRVFERAWYGAGADLPDGYDTMRRNLIAMRTLVDA